MVLIPIACFLPVVAAERVLLIGSVLLLLIVELLNSSVEAAIDRIGLDTHRFSKRAKDLGSAAVFLTLVLLATTWGLVAAPALASLIRVVASAS
jgi:diacylglycerol kinase (ATP)